MNWFVQFANNHRGVNTEDLSVQFLEPTVGGLTGKQLSMLRKLELLDEDDERCTFEYFPKDAQGPAERCIEQQLAGTEFCEDHIPEPDYDSLNKDRDYE